MVSIFDLFDIFLAELRQKVISYNFAYNTYVNLYQCFNLSNCFLLIRWIFLYRNMFRNIVFYVVLLLEKEITYFLLEKV